MNQHNRKDPRAKVLSMTVRYRSATLNEFIEHHSYDVSRGGVFITTPSPFPPGTLLKFEVKIADDQRVMQGVGRVVWKRDVPNGKTEPAGMGIKFIKLDDASRAVIERLVASRGDDTVSAYDRSPESQATDMFSSFGDPGSAEDPTVIRPRDEVLAVAPSSAPSGTGPNTPPAPSGPLLSVGAPASATFSEAPGSLPAPSGQRAGNSSAQMAAPATLAPSAASSKAPPPPAKKAASAPPRPGARSVPRNPVNPSEPPADTTSRGVLWVTLAALVVGGGFAYLTWIRPKVEDPPPVPVSTRAAEVHVAEEEKNPEPPALDSPEGASEGEAAREAPAAGEAEVLQPPADAGPEATSPAAAPIVPAPAPVVQPKARPKPKATTSPAPSPSEPAARAPESPEAAPDPETPKSPEPSGGTNPAPEPSPSAPTGSAEDEFR